MKVAPISNIQQQEAGPSATIRYLAESLIVVGILAFGVFGAVTYLTWLDSWGAIGVDFRASTWEPGRAILDGRSPYPEPGSSWPALYPPPYMLVLSPLVLLPFGVAAGLWLLLLSGAIVLALWVAGLRDWRCYSIALLSLPAVASLGAGNATALLMLATALLWKWRDRPHYGAAAFTCGLLIKPILWPLVLWLVITRRIRLAVETAVMTGGALLVGWAIIQFHGLADYPTLLREHAEATASNGLLVTNLLLDSGVPYRAAAAASLLLGVCLLASALWIQDDLRRFTLGIAAALLMTPVMFVHYFLLLYVPLAVRYPRFSLVWLTPVPLWFIAGAYEIDGTRPLWTSVLGLLVLGAMVTALAHRRGSSAYPISS